MDPNFLAALVMAAVKKRLTAQQWQLSKTSATSCVALYNPTRLVTRVTLVTNLVAA